MISDIEGNFYVTVQIGDQCWMAENLRVSTYRNGHEIPNYPVQADWNTAILGGWVYYSNNSNFNDVYGKIYNWFTITDTRGVCPQHWKVPSDEDWKILEMQIGLNDLEADYRGWRGAEQNAGGKLKTPGTQFWEPPNENASNESGFSGLPSGIRHPDGRFASLGRGAFYWTSSWYSISEAYGRALTYSQSGVSRGTYTKEFGLSIRCILDQELADEF